MGYIVILVALYIIYWPSDTGSEESPDSWLESEKRRDDILNKKDR